MDVSNGNSFRRSINSGLLYIAGIIKKRSFRRVLLYIIAGVLLMPGIIFLSVLAGVAGKIPGKEELASIQNPLATEIYTSDNVLMGRYYIQNRHFLDPAAIPDTVKMALIATEDNRFYRHGGIDFRSLVRVLVKTLMLGKDNSGGGSTLTQQLVKNIYPRKEYRVFSMPVNKSLEMICAMRIENIYSKEQILELYLSTVPFGEETYGIESASLQFFGRNLDELRTEEMALLVGMLKASGTYNPVKRPGNALFRRNVVLSQMAKYGYIPVEVADSLSNLPLLLNYRPLPHDEGIAPYFREFLRSEMDKWCTSNLNSDGRAYNLYMDGLKIYTTIDSRLQGYAEDAIMEHMSNLQRLFDEHWKGRDVWKGIPEEQLLINYDGKYSPEMSSGAPRTMSVFTWDGMQERDYNTLDSIKHYLGFLQAGFLAMEVGTGEILAWVGGINNKYYKYDHVLARRQAGSVFKPLVYLTALEQGISPCEYFPNDSIVYHDYDSWTPRNADRTYGGYYSLAGALVNSVNTVSAALIFETGVDSVISLAHKAGIKSELPAVPSLALGTGNVSLMEMTGVYQAIANRGVLKKPVYISRIEDKEGNILFEANASDATGEVICTPENAEIMTEMLRGVVSRGTGASLKYRYSLNTDIAAKTGTTQNYTDGWFIGYTPSLVAGVWVGGDLQNLRFREMRYGQGAFTALPVWAKFMEKSISDGSWNYLQYEQFKISEDTRSRLDCEDFVERRPSRIRLLRDLKELPFFQRLFRRKRN